MIYKSKFRYNSEYPFDTPIYIYIIMGEGKKKCGKGEKWGHKIE